MRTFTKALAAVALTVASMSSFAAVVNWTGTLSGIKVQYQPSFDDAISPAIMLIAPNGTTFTTVSGGSCLANSLRLFNGTVAEANALHDALLAAKAVNGSVTIAYENGNSSCQIQSWTRN